MLLKHNQFSFSHKRELLRAPTAGIPAIGVLVFFLKQPAGMVDNVISLSRRALLWRNVFDGTGGL